MTVREAFAAAGHPVPADGTTMHVKFDENTWCIDSDYGLFEFSDRDAIIEDAKGWGHDISGLVDIAAVPEFDWLCFPLSEPENNEFDVRFDLSNLPAADAYDALPEVVQKVVQR